MHKLPPLPYTLDALEPHISKETLTYHYGKHHQTYVDNLNKLIKDTPKQSTPLDTLIKTEQGAIFNNAAQIWNHTFYWHCLTPNATQQPHNKLLSEIDQLFGSFEKFKEQFNQKALGNFGSGWTWLVRNKSNDLEIVNTSNADTPIRHDQTALLTCDVWEHAYYIDYRNARAQYLQAFWELVNWNFVQDNDLV